MVTTPVNDSEHYLLPRHPSGVDRLDVQHYAMRETLPRKRPGPAAQRMTDLVRPLLAVLALATTSEVYRSLDGYLRDAGLTNVQRHEISVPIGSWGGTVGSLMVTDHRAGATRVCEVLQDRGMLSAGEARELIQQTQREWEDGRMAHPVTIGQKPLGQVSCRSRHALCHPHD